MVDGEADARRSKRTTTRSQQEGVTEVLGSGPLPLLARYAGLAENDRQQAKPNVPMVRIGNRQDRLASDHELALADPRTAHRTQALAEPGSRPGGALASKVALACQPNQHASAPQSRHREMLRHPNQHPALDHLREVGATLFKRYSCGDDASQPGHRGAVGAVFELPVLCSAERARPTVASFEALLNGTWEGIISAV